MKSRRWVSIGVGTVALLAGAVAIAQVHGAHGDHSHGDAHAAHGHEGHGAHGATLALNEGKKWQTDPPLRAGMEALREEVAKAVDPIHGKTYTAAQYEALAGKVEKHLVDIMAQCKLPPDADAQLHILLVELFGGVETMKKGGDRKKGAARILRALESYPAYFDHPGWKAIEH